MGNKTQKCLVSLQLNIKLLEADTFINLFGKKNTAIYPVLFRSCCIFKASRAFTNFARKFAAEKDFVRTYLQHLKYLRIKVNYKSKRKGKEQGKKDYNWTAMQESAMVKKLKVAVLVLFLKKHNLFKRKMNKSEKVQMISAWLPMQLLKATKHVTGGGGGGECPRPMTLKLFIVLK